MNPFCEIVKAKISESFEERLVDSCEFISNDSSSCSILTPRFLVTFFLDERDNSVSSSIVFQDVPESEREELHSHVISKFFPKLRWINEQNGDVSSKVGLEVENVKNLLRSITEENLSATDMLYFYLGYNAAYTDYMNHN
jgi:hypothetical protein